MKNVFRIVASGSSTQDTGALVFVGRRHVLLSERVGRLLPEAAAAAWPAMVESCQPGDAGAATSTWIAEARPVQVTACVLPEHCSRHNSPARPHAISELLSKAISPSGQTHVVLCVEEVGHATAAVCAAARALSDYSRKTSDPSRVRHVEVQLCCDGAEGVDLEALAMVTDGVRLAAMLVDSPASELHTDAFVALARETASSLGTKITVIQGEALAEAGFGGLWGVGRAAVHPPALVVMEHTPAAANSETKTVGWVGKGIVYDTGGLSIKSKTGMPGMKTDMGGAAAVLGAFGAAVRRGTSHRLVAILCLAENSVGPDAFRPDDILQMYSGKTVEVNNTDAEGRLVLADGVAYLTRHHDPDVVIDLATLTGAQLVATGQRHAAIVCNDEALEQATVEAGRLTGDLVHPLPYCPEFFRKEFKSPVADMKNSVKDRMNAQSSCAGQFVAEHLVEHEGLWLHVDLAGPSTRGERGTGYGVSLLVELLERV